MKPEPWRDGLTTAQRGYGSRWQKAREWWLIRHPLCVFCQAKGRVELATVVDHRIPHRGNKQLFWDRDNWQGLCETCHNSVKARMEHGRPAPVQIGLDGWPVEPTGGKAPDSEQDLS